MSRQNLSRQNSSRQNSSRLWDKGVDIDALVLRYTVGEDAVLDARLVEHDVRASIAHATMLSVQGYLEISDKKALCAALEEIGESHARGEWHIAVEEEDCHTAIENRLQEKLGGLGGRIHLGRSRNDQVLAALRLYLLAAADELAGSADGLATALDAIVGEFGALALPGYTHMQRAMPSSIGLWAGAYASELRDDVEGLRATRRRLSKNPLGSAAGYGVPVVSLDRELTGNLLGFDAVQEPVTAVQLSRGKAEAQIVFEIVLLLQDLGRLASDLCLFATSEFGFVRLPVKLTTGSSIMPQKRNPDVFELVRGRSAQSSADLQAVLAITSKMTSGYHRDLQLIKAPVFRAVDHAFDTVAIMTLAIPQVEFVSERMEAAMDTSLRATEKAYKLVEKEGIPFREAYRRVAEEFRC